MLDAERARLFIYSNEHRVSAFSVDHAKHNSTLAKEPDMLRLLQGYQYHSLPSRVPT